MPDYASWIAEKRAEALELGGKPLRYLPSAGKSHGLRDVQGRETGEIVNPVTGEVFTDCLTISKLSASLNITAKQLTDELEKLGCVHRVLKYHTVPAISAPHMTKAVYYEGPEATPWGEENGLVIPVNVHRGGRDLEMLLITPAGQALVRKPKAPERPVKSRAEERRKTVLELLRDGLSQSAIVYQTGIPKQTVSRIVKTTLETA